jgi:hypothetical protein
MAYMLKNEGKHVKRQALEALRRNRHGGSGQRENKGNLSIICNTIVAAI